MARIGGGRGRLVQNGTVVMVLLLALNSRWNVIPEEPACPDLKARNRGRVIDQLVGDMMFGGDCGVDPSAKRRHVTGLKGTPLRKILALPE